MSPSASLSSRLSSTSAAPPPSAAASTLDVVFERHCSNVHSVLAAGVVKLDPTARIHKLRKEVFSDARALLPERYSHHDLDVYPAGSSDVDLSDHSAACDPVDPISSLLPASEELDRNMRRVIIVIRPLQLAPSQVTEAAGPASDVSTQRLIKRIIEVQEKMTADLKRMKMAAAVASSAASSLCPDAEWDSFVDLYAAEDGTRCGWLPPAPGRMQCAAAADKLANWLGLREPPGALTEHRDQHPLFLDLLRLSLSPSARDGPFELPEDEHRLPSLVVDGVGRLVHCIDSAYLSGLSPDFSLFLTGHSVSAAACAFNIDVQIDDELDAEHKLRALRYNQRAMAANPTRSAALTAVTNLRQIVFVRTSRVPKQTDYVEQHSVEYDVVQAGWEMLLAIIRDATWTGQRLPALVCDGQQVEVKTYLGAGACARVWEGHIQPAASSTATTASGTDPVKLACKTFEKNDEQLFDAELSIWQEIARRRLDKPSLAADTPTRLTCYSHYRPSEPSSAQRSDALPSPLASSSSSSASPSSIASTPTPPAQCVVSLHCLFFTPVGVRPTVDACQSVGFIRDMFACVADLRRLGIVHRDLTPRHFLRSSIASDADSASHGLFLIDFGFSQLRSLTAADPAPLPVQFCGSTHFAPTSLLRKLAEPRNSTAPPFEYCPLLAHDLESLVKVCYACVRTEDIAALRELVSEDFQGIADFWDDVERLMANSLQSWKRAMDCARADNWEAAKLAVEGNFRRAAR